MTIAQEDAMYEFLENARKPFTLKEITQAVRAVERAGGARLASQIVYLMQTYRLVFESEKNHYLSRRALFEKGRFVIQPTKSELQNGVLIPGHRCVPFANPALSPSKYEFYFNDKPCPASSSEGDPEDFYPYYIIFGEEYAPHYIAGDNKENENAFTLDPVEEPDEVSIRTFDLRALFRELQFTPGDCFVASIRDWKKGHFNLEFVKKGTWGENALLEWQKAAEKGFAESFEKIGAGYSCEEQIAWAYFYGGEKMRSVPSYSLEDFLYQKTEKIETVPFGIESRYWFAGKDILDFDGLKGTMSQGELTPIEEVLARNGIPISEFALQSFVRDALYRRDLDIGALLRRVIPPSIRIDRWSLEFIAQYTINIMTEFAESYSIFKDKTMGPLRQRTAELQTAVIDISARLTKSLIDKAWLPMHTFIVLSQIQTHSAALLEDLDVDDELPESELGMMDASLDSMLETYEDVKEMIEDALLNFRKTNFSLVKPGGKGDSCTTVQIAIGGTDIWRRINIPSNYNLADLQKIIHSSFSWGGHLKSRFAADYKFVTGVTDAHSEIDRKFQLSYLSSAGLTEFNYEYGLNWTVKVVLMSKQDGLPANNVECISGENAPPDEKIEGPLRYRRLLAGLESGLKDESEKARAILGDNYDGTKFSAVECSRALAKLFESTMGPH
jgi:hypothetical protein